LIFSLHLQSKFISIYLSVLIIALCITESLYFYRLDFIGINNPYNQKYQLSEIPLLKNLLVDKPTYDLLMNTKKILDQYPNLPTIVFFDMPGLQYAFGRRSLVSDPWLSNLEYPLTKDNVYNCSVITKSARASDKSIFIVARESGIDPQLRDCLKKSGYPNFMSLIGSVSSSVAGLNEPIRIYFNQKNSPKTSFPKRD
jgi:hypothetical protein